MMRRMIYFGLGALSLTKDHAEKVMKEMVEKGEMDREEGRQFVDEAIKRGEEEKEELRKMIQQELQELKGKLSVVTKTDLEAIEARLKAIEEKLSQE